MLEKRAVFQLTMVPFLMDAVGKGGIVHLRKPPYGENGHFSQDGRLFRKATIVTTQERSFLVDCATILLKVVAQLITATHVGSTIFWEATHSQIGAIVDIVFVFTD